MAKSSFKIICLVNIFLFILIPPLHPQTSDLIFQNLSSADGLPSNTISSIFQDHLGFLWFGTNEGLVQYDGYEFKMYQPDDNDSSSIMGRYMNLSLAVYVYRSILKSRGSSGKVVRCSDCCGIPEHILQCLAIMQIGDVGTAVAACHS